MLDAIAGGQLDVNGAPAVNGAPGTGITALSCGAFNSSIPGKHWSERRDGYAHSDTDRCR
jgi:hypothetical protein